MVYILLFVLLLGPGTAHNDNSQTHQIQGKSNNQTNPVKPTPIINDPAQPISTPHNTRYEHEPSKPKGSDPQWWSVWINALLAGITVATLLLLHSQIKAIRNTERAFLIPVWDDHVHINPEQTNAGLSHCFQWHFKNCGKTPAFITSVYTKFVLIDSIADLSKYPKYGTPVVLQDDPLIPEASLERKIYAPLGIDRDYASIQEEVAFGTKILFAYGFVRYKDAFNKRHETRFGLVYKPSNMRRIGFSGYGFELGGPSAYNKYS